VGATDSEGGFGLLGIRERVQLLNGSVAVTNGAGKGFILKVEVPE
jgi:signal transduction histidine kinase